jgi:F-type H+-transporting ATPase subunit a
MVRCLKQNWLLGVLVVLAAARLAALAPPAVAQDHHDKVAAKDKSDKHAKKDHEDAAHHEPDALEHTMDSHEIHLFTIISPHAIPLPPGITKFMVLELIAALLVLAVYIPLAKRMQTGEPPRGAWDNFFEVLLTFVRDQVAKPSIGDHADRYVPFLWTMFLFVLFNNLLGMVPFMGSATSNIYATAGLALVVFCAIHGSAIMKMAREDPHAHGHEGHGDHGHHADGHHDHAHGHHDHAHGAHHDHHHGHAVAPAGIGGFLTGLKRYMGTLWPQIDVPFPLGYIIQPLVFVIEIVGLLVRNAVLAVRLFANMFAGHMVLATILIFIYAAREVNPALWGAITLSSVFGILALSLLEIFVAFLQAYIFTFLTALFMGMALNPQH